MATPGAHHRPILRATTVGLSLWATSTLGIAGLGGALVGLAGCASAEGNLGIDPGTDPLVVARDPEANLQRRLKAIDQAWADVEAGRADRRATRESLKSLIWTRQLTPVRLRVLDVLLSDTTEEGLADTRNMMRLRLPTETDWKVIEAIGDAAAQRRWTDLTPALVRSYARPIQQPADPERPERRALEALHPGTPVEETVFRVFVESAHATDDATTKVRRDAWELLARLDADGSRRRDLLAAEPDDPAADDTLRALRAAAADLRSIPVTGSELEWLLQLREDTAWWTEASAAIRSLTPEQARGLALRHAEPIRWAAAERRQWLSLDRRALLDELASRLKDRRIHERDAEAGSAFGNRRERLRENADRLVWGDLLAILVIDEAIRDPRVMAAFMTQVVEDRRDTSTEHGGVLEWVGRTAEVGGASGAPGFRAVHYPPRATQRVNDLTFIASDDMFRASARSLAHYHFHVQDARNGSYAGPGPGDLEYADKHSRNCLVITSIDARTLNVDYYQRGGAVIDLGEIGR